jgi:hypothetical protein
VGSNGYALALAWLTLIGGAFADAYSRARMLSTASLLFGASPLAAFAAGYGMSSRQF